MRPPILRLPARFPEFAPVVERCADRTPLTITPMIRSERVTYPVHFREQGIMQFIALIRTLCTAYQIAKPVRI